MVIVDDEQDLKYLLKLFFMKFWVIPEGNISLASNGSDAFELVKNLIENNRLPLVLVTDIRMPGINSIELL